MNPYDFIDAIHSPIPGMRIGHATIARFSAAPIDYYDDRITKRAALCIQDALTDVIKNAKHSDVIDIQISVVRRELDAPTSEPA